MSIPQIRSSQITTTFGPGAMVDLPESSVIISGLEHWKYDKTAPIPFVHEPRLVAKLSKQLGKSPLYLRKPPALKDVRMNENRPGITGFRFPEWGIVQNIEWRGSFRARKLVNIRRLDGDRYKDGGKTYPVVPVRFVRACEHGHIGDIDWKAFVHGQASECEGQLWLEETGTSGELAHVQVSCDCGKAQRLSQAAEDKRILGNCNGARPWLGEYSKEACGRPNRLLIRSASNAYFPQLISVISIPDKSGPLVEIVRGLWDDFLCDVESGADLVKARNKRTPAEKLKEFSDEAVLKAIAVVRGAGAAMESEVPVKEVEFAALVDAKESLGVDKPDGDFFARNLARKHWDKSWMKGIAKVVIVDRLREVVATIGFTRFESAGTDLKGELDLDIKPAALAYNDSTNWLPATENRGEGVFILFDKAAVDEWAERSAVKDRSARLASGFKNWCDEHKLERAFYGAPFYMIHSFSHMLLSSLSLECGYPASSLRERIYVTESGYGLLIYTGSSDAEGTLGGLAQAGHDIAKHIRHALESGLLCANDPVCAHHLPHEHDQRGLHGASCHGCLLISETSCEQRNEYLDRALVVPTVTASDCAFFSF